MSTTTMCQRCVVRPAARLWNLCLPCFQDWWNTWVSNGETVGGAPHYSRQTPQRRTK